MKEKYDVIIVGSGAGGAALAAALSERWKGADEKILVIEAGPFIKSQHTGNFWQMVIFNGYYSKLAGPNKSKKGSTIYRTMNVGGSTVVSCGNMVRSCQATFANYGIHLEDAFQEVEQDMGIKPCESIVTGTRGIMDAANKIGENMVPMPKGRYPNAKCIACGNCVMGCRMGVKWDARSYIKQAIDNGVEILPSTKVKKVVFTQTGKAKGVQVGNAAIKSDFVILAAGALSTPVILQASGIDAGHGLFVDFFNVTYGIIEGGDGKEPVNQLKGASMGTVLTDYHKSEGFVLSPFIDHWSSFALFLPWRWNMSHGFPYKRVLGIMTKITDERVGRVWASGKVSKVPTRQDLYRLDTGAAKAREILEAAGARDFITTRDWHRGAHPGGTAAVGEVVDSNLMVNNHEGLYVCDASVFPAAPGLPPILTIVALARWLGTMLQLR